MIWILLVTCSSYSSLPVSYFDEEMEGRMLFRSGIFFSEKKCTERSQQLKKDHKNCLSFCVKVEH